MGGAVMKLFWPALILLSSAMAGIAINIQLQELFTDMPMYGYLP